MGEADTGSSDLVGAIHILDIPATRRKPFLKRENRENWGMYLANCLEIHGRDEKQFFTIKCPHVREKKVI